MSESPETSTLSDDDMQILSNSDNMIAIVAAYVSHNAVRIDELPSLIKAVQNALAPDARAPANDAVELLVPAVPIKKSVFADYIVCLEDGKQLKMLKRYLMTNYKMTPAVYRKRWNLPANYPMVAPNYAERRSLLAKEIGLGRKPGEGKRVAANAAAERSATMPNAVAANDEDTSAMPAAPRRRGRPPNNGVGAASAPSR